MLSAAELPPSEIGARVTIQPDPSLFAALKDDPHAQVDTFIRRFWPQAFRVAFLILRDRQRAEDVAQESVWAAIRSVDSLDGNRPVLPWIHRVAANRALDVLRSAELRHSTPAGTADETHALAAGEPAAATSDPALAGALGQLSEEDRAAVVLRYVLGHSVPEVAEWLGVGEVAMRSRLHRAIRTLRERLDSGGP